MAAAAEKGIDVAFLLLLLLGRFLPPFTGGGEVKDPQIKRHSFPCFVLLETVSPERKFRLKPQVPEDAHARTDNMCFTFGRPLPRSPSSSSTQVAHHHRQFLCFAALPFFSGEPSRNPPLRSLFVVAVGFSSAFPPFPQSPRGGYHPPPPHPPHPPPRKTGGGGGRGGGKERGAREGEEPRGAGKDQWASSEARGGSWHHPGKDFFPLSICR